MNPRVRILQKGKQYDNSVFQTIVLFVVLLSRVIIQKISKKDKPTIALKVWETNTHTRVDNGLGTQWGWKRHTGRTWSQNTQWESHRSMATTSPASSTSPWDTQIRPSPCFSPLRIYLPKWSCSCDIPAKASHWLVCLVPLDPGICQYFGLKVEERFHTACETRFSVCVFPMSECFCVKQTGETFGEGKKKIGATLGGSEQSRDCGSWGEE